MISMPKLSAQIKALLWAVPLCTAAALLMGAGQNGTATSANIGSLLGLSQYSILYSGGPASAPTGLAMSATASFPLLSSASAAPTWATVQYPTSCTSGGVVYASSGTALACSSTVTAHGLIVSGGAGTAPSALAIGGANFPLIGVASSNPAWSTIAYPSSVTQWGIMYASSTTQLASTSALTANALIKAGSSAAPSASSLVDNGTTVTTTEPILAGNTTVLTSDQTTTSSTAATLNLAMASVPISQSRKGSCDLIVQSNGTTNALQIYLNTSAASTAFQILNSIVYPTTGSASIQLPPAVVTSATSTAASNTFVTPASGTSYAIHIDFSLRTNGSNAEVITVYGAIAGGSTLTLKANSTCSWLP